MHVIEIIQKKRDRHPLSQQEINFLVNQYVDGALPDYQASAFLMATCINGMNDEEIAWLTHAMLHSGEVIEHDHGDAPLIDKHSTGGVGDKISIPLAPAMAACGLRVPMIAGRGLGHTGGTLDKLEAIPGFRCDLTSAEYKKQVRDIGCVIMGQTSSIAPADKKLYALRDVTGSVESIPLISSSIMSKKLAEGIDGLVLDVKYGSGAFMQELTHARMLAQTMVAIGAHMGKKITACLTNMDQPLGTMVGNALEIKESIDILQGKGPQDTVELTVLLGAEMLLLANRVTTLDEGREHVREVLSSGRAFNKFVEMVKAQGGDVRYLYEPDRLLCAPRKIVVQASANGFIKCIDSRAIGIASSMLGGGRITLTDKIDMRVGIEMHARNGDEIARGEPLCTIHADVKGVDEAIARINNAVTIVAERTSTLALCHERITSI